MWNWSTWSVKCSESWDRLGCEGSTRWSLRLSGIEGRICRLHSKETSKCHSLFVPLWLNLFFKCSLRRMQPLNWDTAYILYSHCMFPEHRVNLVFELLRAWGHFLFCSNKPASLFDMSCLVWFHVCVGGELTVVIKNTKHMLQHGTHVEHTLIQGWLRVSCMVNRFLEEEKAAE